MAKKIIIAVAGFLAAALATALTIKLALVVKGDAMFEVGDYYFEVDPALLSFVQNPSFNIYSDLVPPLMTPLSVEIRAIVSWFAFKIGLISLNDNPVDFFSDFNRRYVIGAGSVIVVGYAALFYSLFKNSLTKITRDSVFYTIGAILIIAINPLSLSALNWSHPEEILLAALIASSGLMILKKEYLFAAIFAGGALATKQPAVFLIPAAFFAIPPGTRKKFILVTIGTFLALSLPWVIFGFKDFVAANFFAAGGQDFNINRGLEVFTGLGLRDIAEIGKPLIALAAILIPLSAARINQTEKSWRPSKLAITGFQFAVTIPLVFLIRSVFDLGNIAYYALPAGLSFILIDYIWQKNSDRFKNVPVTLPIITTVGSVALWLLFYRDIEINPELRGLITALVSFAAIGVGLFYIYGKEKIQELTKESLITAGGFLVAAVLILGASHFVLNNPDPILQYKTFKFFPKEKINLALPDGQKAYWGSDAITRDITLEKQGLHPNIIFTRYSKKGEVTSTFVYGNKNSGAKIEIETYNKIPEKEKAFALQCLRRNKCLQFKPFKTDLGPLFFKETGDQLTNSWKSNNWEAFLIVDSSEQLVRVTNGGLPVSLEEVILKINSF